MNRWDVMAISAVGAEGLNPRPSPCKGEKNLQVRALNSRNALPLSTAEYLGVRLSCYADVMQPGHRDDRQERGSKSCPADRSPHGMGIEVLGTL